MIEESTTWHASPDAVPDGFVQVTVADEKTGERVATVFSAEAVPLVEAAPDLLAAAWLAIDAVELTEQEDVPAWLVALESAARRAAGL